MTNIELEFKRIIEGLAGELISIDSKLELLFHMDKKLRKDALDELNISPAFFGLTIDSLKTDTIISLSRFFENKRQTQNIFHLLEFVHKNLSLFSQESFKNRTGVTELLYPQQQITLKTVTQHKKELAEVNSILKNLHFWRNKRYAHLERQFFYEPLELTSKAPLRYTDLRRLIKLAGQILNTYLVAFEDRSNTFRATNLCDVDTVIDILKKYRQSLIK